MKTVIRTPFITLEALLKFSGLVESGGRAKELIKEGSVKVDGTVVTERGRKIRPGMTVSLRGLPEKVEVTAAGGRDGEP